MAGPGSDVEDKETDNKGLSGNQLKTAETSIKPDTGPSSDSPGTSSTSNNSGAGGNVSLGGPGGFYSSSSGAGQSKGSGTSANQTEASGGLYLNTKTSKKKGGLKALAKKRKKALIFGGGGVAGVAILVILLLFLYSLLLPNFAANMLAYQFARVNRDFAQDTEEIASEKAALESPSDPANQESAPLEDDPAIAEDFDDTGGLLAKFNQFIPKKVVENLQNTGNLDYNYARTGLFQGKTLQSIQVGDQTINLSSTDPSIFTKVLHPIQTFNNQVQAATDLSAGLDSTPAAETGIIVRGAVESQIREAAGIPLYAWIYSKFAGKSPSDAEVLLDQDAESRISPSTDPQPASEDDAITTGEQEGDSTLQQDANNPTVVKAIIADNGEDEAEDNVVSAALKPSTAADIESKGSLGAIAISACIIYDASLQSGGAQQTIDNQDNEVQRSFYYVESAADQQKAGNANAEVVGAMDTKLGDIAQSNVEIRANGGNIDSLSSFQSPQASAGGQYSILNTFLPSWLAYVVNGIVNNPLHLSCSTLTSPTFQLAAFATQVVGTIISSIPSGETAAAGEDATIVGTEDGVETAIDQTVLDDPVIQQTLKSQLTANPVTGTLLRASGKFAEKFSKKELKKLAVTSLITGGLSIYAKEATLAKMGETYNGFSQGIDFANQADAGANLNSNEVERQELYGAPLDATNLAYNNKQDVQYVTKENESGDAYNRYLAVSNPESLISRIGIPIAADIHSMSIASVFSGIKSLFSPLKLASGVLDLFKSSKVSAATAIDESDYGIVQWGYTAYENSLIDPKIPPPPGITTQMKASYQPLENSQILFSSGEDGYLETTYGPCYNLTMGQLLTESPQSGPGAHEAYIVRDQNGNVTGGRCSQEYLGPNSMDTNASDNTDGGRFGNDMVFRWRLNHGYNNSMDNLGVIQSATT